MAYTRERVERILIGTLLNEYGYDGFMRNGGSVLRAEMFCDKRNAFIFSVIRRMDGDGAVQTTPCDVFRYVTEKGIRCGDTGRLCSYMAEVCENYAWSSFRRYVKMLVDYFLNDKRHGK